MVGGVEGVWAVCGGKLKSSISMPTKKRRKRLQKLIHY